MKLALTASLSFSPFLKATVSPYWQSAVGFTVPKLPVRSLIHQLCSTPAQSQKYTHYSHIWVWSKGWLVHASGSIQTQPIDDYTSDSQSAFSWARAFSTQSACHFLCLFEKEWSRSETPYRTSLLQQSMFHKHTLVFGRKPAACYLSVRHFPLRIQQEGLSLSLRMNSFSRCSQKAEIYEGFGRVCQWGAHFFL